MKNSTTVEAFQRFKGERKKVKVVDEVRYTEYRRLALQASRMMFGEKATVGFEKTEETNRVIVGYFVD